MSKKEDTKKGKGGRPKGKNFEFLKAIKLNQRQVDNWDSDTPKLIRDLLEGKFIDTKILKKMIPKFIEYGIELKNTTEIEDKRIMELIKECQ